MVKVRLLLLLIAIAAILVVAAALTISAAISSHIGPFPQGEYLVKFDVSECPTEKGFDEPIKVKLESGLPLGLSVFAFLARWRLDFGEQKSLSGGWMDSENQLWFSGANGSLIVVDTAEINYYPRGHVGECSITGALIN